MIRRVVVAAAGVALTTGLLTGCESKKQAAAVVITMPDSPSVTPTGISTRTVNLGVGQVLGVQVQYYDEPVNWEQVSAGSGKLLKSDGEDTLQGCGKGSIGCRPRVRERYKALAAGTTTIEWDWVSVITDSEKTPIATVHCPKEALATSCPAFAIEKIVVTVT